MSIAGHMCQGQKSSFWRMVVLLGSLHSPWKVRPKTPRPTEEFRGVASHFCPVTVPKTNGQKGPKNTQNDALEKVNSL